MAAERPTDPNCTQAIPALKALVKAWSDGQLLVMAVDANSGLWDPLGRPQARESKHALLLKGHGSGLGPFGKLQRNLNQHGLI